MAVILDGGCRVSNMREGEPGLAGTLRVWSQIGRSTGAQAISLRVLEFGGSKFWSLVFGIWSFGSQPDRMSRVETARWPINGLPARRPFAGVTIERRRIESQASNHGESVTLACVDGDPFARAALAIAAKLC